MQGVAVRPWVVVPQLGLAMAAAMVVMAMVVAASIQAAVGMGVSG